MTSAERHNHLSLFAHLAYRKCDIVTYGLNKTSTNVDSLILVNICEKKLMFYVKDVNFQLQLEAFTAGSNFWWSIKN